MLSGAELNEQLKQIGNDLKRLNLSMRENLSARFRLRQLFSLASPDFKTSEAALELDELDDESCHDLATLIFTHTDSTDWEFHDTPLSSMIQAWVKEAQALEEATQSEAVKSSPYVLFQSERSERAITVLKSVPFYRSTGESSKSRGSWLPFHSMSEELNYHIHAPHGLIDPRLPEILSVFPQDRLYERFNHLEAACYSSMLGQGIWDTIAGHIVKRHLLINFPEHFAERVVVAVEPEAHFTLASGSELSDWIQQQQAAQSSEETLPVEYEQRFPLFRAR